MIRHKGYYITLRLYNELDRLKKLYESIIYAFENNLFDENDNFPITLLEETKIYKVYEDLLKTIYNKNTMSFSKLCAKIGFYQGVITRNGNTKDWLFHNDTDF